jgi:RsiG-like
VNADPRDLAALRAELEQLERDEHEVSAYRRKLHERIDRFPSEAAVNEERQVSDKRRALHRRIDELRDLLA